MLWLLGVIAAAVVLHTLGQRRNTTDAFGRSEDDIRYPWERPLLRCPRLLITYVDFEGNATEREITPKFIAGPAKNKPDRILAYCHYREAPRAFVLARIQAAAVAGTGEIIPNVKRFVKLYARAE